jgi:uncharacterized protein with HEPN domain
MADAMTARRTALDWFSDIVEWGNRPDKHLAGVNWESFLHSPLLQDATSKCAEAVGEAAGQLLEIDPDLDTAYPDLQLRLAYMSRNKLSHGYHTIDTAILWATVSEAIPRTVAAARKVIRDNDGSAG